VRITGCRGFLKQGLVLSTLPLAGCTRAPSFDIFGSFFPAWLACLMAGILLSVFTRWLLLRLHIAVALPALTYLCLTALFTFGLWLAFFR
jgi:hypothetical protein